MNTKKILSVFLSSLFVFSMLVDGVGIKDVKAQGVEELQDQSLDGQSMTIDGEQVSFTEKNNVDGSVILDIDWNNGKKEQLIYKQDKDGLINAKVVSNGKIDYITTDYEGNVYLNGEMEIEAGEQIESDVGTQAYEWSHLRTFYSKSSVYVGDLALTVGLVAAALKASKAASVVVTIASWAIGRSLPTVYFKVNEYYRFYNNQNQGLKHIHTYRYSNYTTLLRKDRLQYNIMH